MPKLVHIFVLSVLLVALPHFARAEPFRLLAFGDSLTAGYGLPEKDGFTSQLQQALRARGHDVVVINGGVSGDTMAGGLERVEWSLADKPQAVIVALGGNDLLRAIDPQRTRASLDAILSKFTDAGVKVLLAGMLAPVNLGPDYRAAFDALYPELAAKYQVAFYPFFLDGVATVRKYTQNDGLHPNAEGVAEMVVRILPSVESLIADAQQK
jgi:acyl-CoA thioesterase I